MCGRYVVKNPVTKTSSLVKSAIQVEDNENYNAHPNQKLPVIKKYKNGNTLENLKWGLVPNWAKNKDFKSLINARIETIDEKISFKKLIKNKRCVAVADGFYEWRREEKVKTPHYFVRKDNNTIYFAGIYENDQFCLITEEAQNNIKEIHHRQPVILIQNDINRYLNLELQGSAFLKERKIPDLTFYQVSKDVNKPTNNTASLIQKI
jgi:putative SOS response-associated peptidase YedK|tara:strand:- start:24 stop:644 length:621 start_codon:yes stop_codon:yes gene_type:complete